MKKIINVIFALSSFVFILSSCEGDSYVKRLEDAEKAVDRYIKQNGIQVLSKYPDDGVFAENQYYKDPTGMYFRVISLGDNEVKPTKDPATQIYLRHDTIFNLLEDRKIGGNPNWDYASPMTFAYGQLDTYSSTTSGTQEYAYLSQSCVVPLDYGLGNNAEVSLIVPFLVGSTQQNALYAPFYYKRLKYSFTRPITEE